MGISIADYQKMKARVEGKTAPEQAQNYSDEPNKTELAFSQFLRSAQPESLILFQKVKIRLAKKTWYTPDFLVLHPQLGISFFEVKGFMRDDAAVKLKVAADQYRIWKFFLVRKTKGGWDIKCVSP